MAVYCSNCGTEIPAGVKYCTECGVPIPGTGIVREPIMPRRYAPPPVQDQWICPRCNGPMIAQTVAEQDSAGCFTIFLYILLALTVLGLLVLVPILLSKHTVNRTYAVCTRCGHRVYISG